MPDIYGSSFTYGTGDSDTYGLIIASGNSGRFIGVSGEIKPATIFNRKAKKNYLIIDDYSDSPLSFDVDIVTADATVLTTAQQRAIVKWLFNRHNYRQLRLDEWECVLSGGSPYDDPTHMYLNCRFLNPEKIEGSNGVFGYKCTLECDAPVIWKDPVSRTFTFSNTTSSSTNSISMAIDCDFDDYIYPEVKVTMGSTGGNFIIINTTDDSTRYTKFVNMTASSSVTMKGEINMVSGDYYEKFENQNFVRLLDGTNTLTVNGDVASVKITYQDRRAF